eukprot:CAMPEP_0185842122 /NCGR_PEP_ID=MMETSP1353-20130828/18246_1 /TAXON_ID=1077150 /ORGANISM="Erythrolobus australicus, Strain CCMP3124" /LENGTH=89 /DNA_ID=CAMNT_0028541619 /DNA_START=945 /DNA_END=1214 /DNA_ORIENTATION=+
MAAVETSATLRDGKSAPKAAAAKVQQNETKKAKKSRWFTEDISAMLAPYPEHVKGSTVLRSRKSAIGLSDILNGRSALAGDQQQRLSSE